MVVAEHMCPETPKIFPLWSFKKKFADPVTCWEARQVKVLSGRNDVEWLRGTAEGEGPRNHVSVPLFPFCPLLCGLRQLWAGKCLTACSLLGGGVADSYGVNAPTTAAFKLLAEATGCTSEGVYGQPGIHGREAGGMVSRQCGKPSE